MSQSKRDAIVAAAMSWIGTPYRNTGCLRGVGVNCAMLLYGVAKDAGVLPADAPPPRWYSSQLHVHSKDERLVEYVKSYGAREVTEAEVLPGDFLLYKAGKSHGHAAIVIEWPEKIVHCLPPAGCAMGHALEGRLARYDRKFFALV